MILPKVVASYSVPLERERNRTLEREIQRRRRIDTDVEIGDQQLILTAPDGSRWTVNVANDGTLSATEIT